jgi:8-oxo-dGTP pyrophosphatase MutT (NUDIX family)
MLAFSLRPDRRFQMRAVAIIRREGYLLIHRATHETFWSLPGGRVEFGETAAEALEREIVEELGCRSTISELRYLVENFFSYKGESRHEIGWYYDAEISSGFPFITDDICHRATENAYELEFRWVKCDAESFALYPLLPPMLPGQLLDASAGFRHIVERES